MEFFSEETLLQKICKKINDKSDLIIGIDGVDNCGKTLLAKFLGERLKIKVFSGDNYLKENRDKCNYIDDLEYDRLKQDVDLVEKTYIDNRIKDEILSHKIDIF